MQIWQEVHGDFNSPETISPVVDLLNDCPEFGIIWDIEHTFNAGVDPDEFYKLFKPLIKHAHFKDCTEKNEDGTRNVTLPGEGTVPLKKYYGLLNDNGFKGFYSFEWEKRWIPDLPDPETAFPVYIELMKKIIG